MKFFLAILSISLSGLSFSAGASPRNFLLTTQLAVRNGPEEFTPNDSACALTSGGVKCWGKHLEIQTPPQDLKNLIQLTVGDTFACGLSDNGNIRCWGQLFDGGSSSPNFNTGAVIPGATRIAAGTGFLCASTPTEVKCWGSLVPGTPYSSVPVRNAKILVASNAFLCASDGAQVQCVGPQALDGFNTPKPNQITQPPTGLNKIFDIAIDDSSDLDGAKACALTDSSVTCWGASGPQNFPLGFVGTSLKDLAFIEGLPVFRNGNRIALPPSVARDLDTSPSAIQGGFTTDKLGQFPDVTALIPLKGAFCALTADGIKCPGGWPTPIPSGGLLHPREILADSHFSCALTDTGEFCWGQPSENYLDDVESLPFDPRSISNVKAGKVPSSPYVYFCGIANGKGFCWANPKLVPASDLDSQNQFLAPITGVRALDLHTQNQYIALAGNQLIYADTFFAPAQVPPLTNPSLFAATSRNTCAVDSKGIQCWGVCNAAANINWNPSDPSPSCINIELAPQDIPSLIAAGEDDANGIGSFCAYSRKGLSCWSEPQMGKPVSALQVPSDLGAVDSIAMRNGTFCVTGNSSVRCWGNNDSGQTQVPKDLGKVQSISVGSNHVCALTESGVRCWGGNDDGQSVPPPDYSLSR